MTENELKQGEIADNNANDYLGMDDKWSDEEKKSGNGENSSSNGSSISSAPITGFYRLHDAIDAHDIDLIKNLLQIHRENQQKKLEQQNVPNQQLNFMYDDDDDNDLDQKDEDECSPLHTAIMAGHLDILELLLEAGCDVMVACEESPVIHVALSVGSLPQNRPFALESVKLLVKFDAPVTDVDRLKCVPLHLCAEFDLDETARFLLNNGAKSTLDSCDYSGQTPLHKACISKATATLKVLLEQGCDVNVQDAFGFSALHFAVKRNFITGVEILLEKSADKTLKTCTGQTALDYASEFDFLDCKNLLASQPLERKKDQATKNTLILSHEICSRHYTCDPIITSKRVADGDRPSENVNRLTVLLNEKHGILHSHRLRNVDWGEAPRAQMADVLRVHENAYISKLKEFCAQLEDDEIGELDGDTSISGASFEAAMHAAGAVCEGVDRVCQGTHRNVFCAVRPPGHHAGPTGVVTNKRDPHGSYGFCLLSNATIAAAYARNVYRHQGIKKVAIIDFDVHHGNGTEECVRNLKPNIRTVKYSTPTCDLQLKTPSYKPWLNENDSDNVYFASVHGFGKRDPRMNQIPGEFENQGEFYPSSGENCGLATSNELQDSDDAAGVVNYGQKTKNRVEWRESWSDYILPKLVKFNPDILIISAGFDAHVRDEINFGYISITEKDYTWLTEELIKVANKCCDGRIVSVLEGGYKIQGKIVSPFARSVYSHVTALVETNAKEQWDESKIHLVIEKEKEDIQSRMEASNAEEGEKKRSHPRRSTAGVVDYAKLNEELEREKQLKKARQEPNQPFEGQDNKMEMEESTNKPTTEKSEE